MAMDDLRAKLSAAHQEALRVGDIPLRADALADRLPALRLDLAASGATEEMQARVGAELEAVERVLRRDDDGREAARHLQNALRLVEDRPRRPSPFLDDD